MGWHDRLVVAWARVVCSLGLMACGNVEASGGPDAMADPPGARCYGTSVVHVCLASAPSQPLSLDGTIDTAAGSAHCVLLVSGGDYCVIAATEITVASLVRATGPRPLVLLATESITTSATIDVSSHRSDPKPGAGAQSAPCTGGTSPTIGVGAAPGSGGAAGGGAGGSFLQPGGRGGVGGDGHSTGGIAGAAILASTVSSLRGGCDGQSGAGAIAAAGGHGGGAVYLIAGRSISVDGGIDASGEGGAGAVPGPPAGSGNGYGGGGGGTGGMVGFDAPAITVTGLVIAEGGGGGQGGSSEFPGNPGADPSSLAEAPGGDGGADNGGAGGFGSVGKQTATVNNGSAGVGNAGFFGGGGGGGGGAGLIKATDLAHLGTSVSPPPVP